VVVSALQTPGLRSSAPLSLDHERGANVARRIYAGCLRRTRLVPGHTRDGVERATLLYDRSCMVRTEHGGSHDEPPRAAVRRDGFFYPAG